MTMEHSRALDEARIRSPHLRCPGADALDEGREGRLSAFRGSVGCEIHDLSITAGDDEALCHGLVRISGSRTGGDQIDVWAPATFCLRKVDGAWKVTNEHTPLPFYMDGSAKPAGDLADYLAQA